MISTVTLKNPLAELGPIKNIVLLGGGGLLRDLCGWTASQGVATKIITAPRHAYTELDGETLVEFLKKHGVPHLVVDEIENPNVKDFLGDTTASFCISLGAAWIFKPDVISSIFDNKLFNLHGTRLPQNRGGGGFSWQILMGNRFGFCVLHRVDSGVDTGDIVALEEFLYPPICRKPVDYQRVYREKNFKFICDFIESIRATSMPINAITQSEYFSTYWPRLSTDLNGWIDWSMDASELERFVCAFDEPYTGARTFLNNSSVRLKSVSLNPQDGYFHSFQSGLVYRKSKDWLCVSIKGSALIVEEIYDDESGHDMLGAVRVGDRLVTPSEMLDSAKGRPMFTPKGLK